MATTAKAGPPTAKVVDVVQHFAPARRFPQTSSHNKPYSVTSLDFDDTGELCLVAQDDDTLQIYNCKEGKHAKELKSQKYGVDLAKFTHHSQSIIYASTKGDDAIRYLSAHDNSYIRYFRGHTAAVTTIALSPSSDAFLSASHDDTVRLWDLRSSSAQGILHLHAPHLAIYDPTATVIAIASPSAQEILLYDARNYDKPPFATFDLLEQENTMRPFSGNAGGPSPPGDWTKLEFSNDGRSLLVTTNGAAHYVLDAFDGRLVAYLLRPAGPTNRISPSSIPSLRASKQTTATGGRATGQGDACFSPDGRFVLSGTASAGSICVWDLDGLEAGEAGAEKVLRPLCELGGELDGNGRKEVGVASVLAYSPRHNLVVGADRGVVFWLPEVD